MDILDRGEYSPAVTGEKRRAKRRVAWRDDLLWQSGDVADNLGPEGRTRAAAGGDDPLHALLIAADTGGAIRGPVRGDVFFGFGPEAERRAGALKAPGRMFVLLPNALATRLGAGFTP